MNADVWIVGGILAVAIVLFVTEWVRVDLVALMVMLGLVLGNVLEGEEAILGFSNEAVITIASVLILSGGLMRTGVARIIGQHVLAAAGTGSRRLIAVMMTTVGLLSGIMNDIGVTALMLPVVLEIARKVEIAPSKLLMPLAFGSLLGGMTTLIGTAPNILVNGALIDAGHDSFGMFSFTWIGLPLLGVGVLYMTFMGRRLLPDRDPRKESSATDLDGLYEMAAELRGLTIPTGSALAGKTLKESRLGHALGLNVVAVERAGDLVLAPRAHFVIEEGDELLVEGQLEQFEALRSWRHLELEDRHKTLKRIATTSLELAEVEIEPDAPIVGQTIRRAKLRQTHHLHVLAIRHGDVIHRTHLRERRLAAGDHLVVAVNRSRIADLAEDDAFVGVHSLESEELITNYHLERRIQSVRIPETSHLSGQGLVETGLADSFGLTVVGILRQGEEHLVPEPDEKLQFGDVLLLRGRKEDLEILDALQDLEISESRPANLSFLESDVVGLAEASLSPRTSVAGKTIEDLRIRSRFGLSILAIWRKGKIYRSRLREMKLLPGDAFLLYGDRSKIALLADHPDFLVLTTKEQAEELRKRKAPTSLFIMGGVLVAVVSGLLPIFVAAPIGALFMVLSGCLRIEEAYRAIEMKAVVLIAGMLSLGRAMQETGTAEIVAESVLGRLAGFGPHALVAGLFLITALSAQVMPTAAVAVLLSPIALSLAEAEGLSPHALMMTVAVGASCAFMSPVGHPVNLLVMGFGGYRFRDFVRVGFPLLIVVMIVVMVLLPLVWPLAG